LKIGPILRGERNARWYLRVFKPQGVSGLRKTALLLTRPKVAEDAVVAGKPIRPGSIVVASGLKNYFKDIAHERDYLAGRFAKLLRPEDAARILAKVPYRIGVHVRLGDFQPHNRIPLAWYVRTIEKIRRAAGSEAPVTVVSDGSDAELAELLALPGVRRLAVNAPAELFALSSSRVILASNSTFSAWAAFLGHVPILWARRDSEFEGIFTDDTFDEVVAADAALPPQLCEYLRRALVTKKQ
jgi:hypothetical protein